ncbi:hypothetical protein NH621_04540 [Lactococcus formosensis]|uniref:hypothetical protein n=1 Tax=Lactococcus formosensis TaxID=1281486 RepID=UPI00209767C6|nr:hypothetical protein [Lactococcus formosensis]MCO7180450.1 hypothetical protein [Lactococcus formosensis]
MAKLSDYGFNVENLENTAKCIIREKEFPIAFTMETMEYIADIYGGDYSQFEADMNAMLKKSEGRITSSNLASSDLKIMRSLIYGMLRTGGLDESSETIFAFLGMSGDVLSIYSVCMEIFTRQAFQVEDLKKSKKPQDFQKAKRKSNRNYKKTFKK